jgi:hypothetical protein
VHFFVDNFPNEILALTWLHGVGQPTVATSEEAGVGLFPQSKVCVGKRRAAGSVKNETFPAKADFPADAPVPDRLNRSHRSEIRFGGDELPAVDKKLVRLEFTKFSRAAAAISGEAAFDPDYEVAKLQIESRLAPADRLSIGFVMPGRVKRGNEI